ncbi:unnamed protein product [Penicillium camemberti]|uniref:Str. FM013 n=1 Tax=Penicillium camemberti (strain FM 013) TaxID=1429867 RepID=A0A0G4NZJ0_PENC3|nr:unnamed protein product [Penicillium camemberti]
MSPNDLQWVAMANPECIWPKSRVDLGQRNNFPPHVREESLHLYDGRSAALGLKHYLI